MQRLQYLEALKSLELLKEDTMKRMDELTEVEMLNKPISRSSSKKKIPMMFNNRPVFQFSFDSMLPLYKNDDREYLAMVRNYYHRLTLGSYDFVNHDTQFNKAALIILHYFKDNRIRDLDNRNRKVIIDAIRHTSLIKDDSWKQLSIMEEGFLDEQNHVQAYLIARSDLVEFLTYLQNHHHEIKKIPNMGEREMIQRQFSAEEEAQKKSVEVRVNALETSRGIWS